MHVSESDELRSDRELLNICLLSVLHATPSPSLLSSLSFSSHVLTLCCSSLYWVNVSVCGCTASSCAPVLSVCVWLSSAEDRGEEVCMRGEPEKREREREIRGCRFSFNHFRLSHTHHIHSTRNQQQLTHVTIRPCNSLVEWIVA